MRLLLSLAFVGLSFGAARAVDIDALYTALQTSDTATVEVFVGEYYRDAGISVNDGLTWEHQAFDQIVNWYNQHTQVIMLSVLPQPTEVAAYWQNWSEVLTQGNWNWQAFFADDAEAALMANFNQFLLAAHEYGHALTFRYDPGHEERYGNEINCREYLPDRLAAALLEEVADKDARIAGLKSRYRALIDEINAHIDPQYRYETPTFAALDADCRVMHVEQPTEESMTPYASAFFVRHGLLQAEDLPPLADVYARHLLPYWRDLQPPASGLAGAVTTGAPIATDADLESAMGDYRYANRQLAFDPSGDLYIVEMGDNSDADPPRVGFGYGPLGEAVEIVVPGYDLVDAMGEFGIFSFSGWAALGPDRFAVTSGGAWLGGMPVLLFDVSRTNHRWSVKVTSLEPDPEVWKDVSQVNLVFDPKGNLYAYLSDYRPGDQPNRWRRLRLDRDTLAVVETVYIPDNGGYPVAVGANGETFFAEDYQISVQGADDTLKAFAGARLQGFKDNADPLLAEFVFSTPPAYPTADGGLKVIDYDLAARAYVLRHVAPAR